MNKIVMLYTDGDGYTYSCDVAQPIFYASCEQALIDFEKLVTDARKAYLTNNDWRLSRFDFAGLKGFDQSDFFIDGTLYLPEFLTVDEWFARDATRDQA